MKFWTSKAPELDERNAAEEESPEFDELSSSCLHMFVESDTDSDCLISPVVST